MSQETIEKGEHDPDAEKVPATPAEEKPSKLVAPDIEDEIKHAPGKPLGVREKLRKGELEKLDGSERPGADSTVTKP